jgi:hypothetical protein
MPRLLFDVAPDWISQLVERAQSGENLAEARPSQIGISVRIHIRVSHVSCSLVWGVALGGSWPLDVLHIGLGTPAVLPHDLIRLVGERLGQG